MSDKLIYWWVGSRIHPPFFLLAGLAIWTVIDCCSGALASFLNGMAVIRFQVIFASLFGVGCLALKVFFIRHYGIESVPWATILSYSLLSVLPFAIYVPHLINRMDIHAEMLTRGSEVEPTNLEDQPQVATRVS
jgi:hypothetical protein